MGTSAIAQNQTTVPNQAFTIQQSYDTTSTTPTPSTTETSFTLEPVEDPIKFLFFHIRGYSSTLATGERDVANGTLRCQETQAQRQNNKVTCFLIEGKNAHGIDMVTAKGEHTFKQSSSFFLVNQVNVTQTGSALPIVELKTMWGPKLLELNSLSMPSPITAFQDLQEKPAKPATTPPASTQKQASSSDTTVIRQNMATNCLLNGELMLMEDAKNKNIKLDTLATPTNCKPNPASITCKTDGRALVCEWNINDILMASGTLLLQAGQGISEIITTTQAAPYNPPSMNVIVTNPSAQNQRNRQIPYTLELKSARGN